MEVKAHIDHGCQYALMDHTSSCDVMTTPRGTGMMSVLTETGKGHTDEGRIGRVMVDCACQISGKTEPTTDNRCLVVSYR